MSSRPDSHSLALLMSFLRPARRLAACLLLLAAPSVAAAQMLAPNAARPSDQPLVIDSAVTVGTLPNGMRYYLRVNGEPEKRAELRLVVKVGSTVEEESQRGVAHFLEHMAFNGSR